MTPMTPEEVEAATAEARKFLTEATGEDHSTSLITYERKSLLAKIGGYWYVLILGAGDDGTQATIITPFTNYFQHTNDMLGFIALSDGDEALQALGVDIDIVRENDEPQGSKPTLN